MLPPTPLHHLLLREIGFPVIATSGNLAEEPICIDEREAVERLAGIAELFLVHDRPIVRHTDDSIVRVIAGREMVLRRARGFAPLPVELSSPPEAASDETEGVAPECILAVGAHLKNTVALAVGPHVFISQHIGDLETVQAYAAFQRVILDFESFYEAHPDVIAADAHPDYLSTRYANARGESVVQVQHHYAHVLACMAENGLQGPLLGVSWDGTGFGSDGTIWGGESRTSGPFGCPAGTKL
jgi:hydrogenase maturation protein HypF